VVVKTSLGPATAWEKMGLPQYDMEKAREEIEEMRERTREAAHTGGMVEETVPMTLVHAAGRLRMEEGAGTFADGGRKYEMWKDRAVAADPVTRVFARHLHLETGGEEGTIGGRRVSMDAQGTRVLTGKNAATADRETGEAMRVAAAIHARTHFTHVAATDGSRRDNRATESETSYGIWWGADVIREGAERREGMAELECTEEQGRGAIAQGLEGGRLPDNWDVLDAELYAIFRALKRVHVESKRRKENPKEKRLLVLTDCKSAIEILEQAWRRERVKTWGDRARLVEAICNVRKEIGVCVLCKVQSHVGVAPNEYADAAAKAHLEAPAEEIEDAVAQMERYLLRAQWVHEERLRGGTWSMTDRAMYATARKRGTVYARRKMNEGVKRDRYCAAAWGPVWEEVAKEATKYDTTTAEEWTEVQAHNDAIGIIMGARSGDTAGVPHEQGWARREGKGVPWEEKTEAQRAETCAAKHGCGACRRSKNAEIKALKEAGMPVSEEEEDQAVPLETIAHYALECEGCETDLRKRLMKEVQDFAWKCNGKGKDGEMGRKGGEQLWQLTTRAAKTMEEAVAGKGGADRERWEGMRQIVGAHLPGWKGHGNGKKRAKAELVHAHRKIVKTISEMRQQAEEAGRVSRAWVQERTQNREWLRLIMRSWKETSRFWRVLKEQRPRWAARREKEMGAATDAPRGAPAAVKMCEAMMTIIEEESEKTKEEKKENMICEEVTVGKYTQSIRYIERGVWYERLRTKTRQLWAWGHLILPERAEKKREAEAKRQARTRWKRVREFIRRAKPKKGGEWHQRLWPAATPPRTRGKQELREDIERVRYREARDWTPTTYVMARRKRKMWKKNEVAVGERLRQYEHSGAPEATGPRTAQPEGVT
jgi:ribonuclease HI